MLNALLARLLFTPLGPGLVVSVMTRNLMPLCFGALFSALDYMVRFIIHSTATRRNLIDATTAINTLHKTHVLLKRPGDKVLPSKVLAQLSKRCEVISAIPRRPSSPTLSALKSYPNPGHFNLIIVNGHSPELSVMEKYYLLHEAGHASQAAYMVEMFLTSPLLQSVIFYLPCILMCKVAWQGWSLVSLCLTELFVTRGSFKSETVADAFAISVIAAEDSENTALRVIRLIQANFKRSLLTPKCRGLRCLDIDARLRVLSDIKAAIESPKKPAIGIAKSIALSYVLPVFVCHVLGSMILMFGSHITSPAIMKAALCGVVGALLLSLFDFLRTLGVNKVFIEQYVWRTVSQEMFDNPDYQRIIWF